MVDATHSRVWDVATVFFLLSAEYGTGEHRKLWLCMD